MGAVAGVADEHEPSVGEPAPQHAQQSAHQLRRHAMASPLVAVVRLGAIQVNEHGQGPRSRGQGEADQHGKNHLAVAVTPSGIGVAGAHGVAVAGLAVDVPTGVPIDGVVTDQGDRRVARKAAHEERVSAQAKRRPNQRADDRTR